MSSLLSRRPSLRKVLSTTGIRVSFWFLKFLPLTEELYESRSRRGRGESDWTGLLSYTHWIRRRSCQLHSQYSLVIYMILPDHMTSWVAHNDVYTGDGLLLLVSYATLTSADIHVWIPLFFSVVSFTVLRSSFTSFTINQYSSLSHYWLRYLRFFFYY